MDKKCDNTNDNRIDTIEKYSHCTMIIYLSFISRGPKEDHSLSLSHSLANVEWIKKEKFKIIHDYLRLYFVFVMEIILLSHKSFAIISINGAIAPGECRDHQ